MSNKDVIVEISQPEIIVEVEQTEFVTDVVVGQKGKDGADGADGADGLSAYEQAVEGGYTGTLEEFEAQLNALPELTGGADTDLHKHDQMYYTESEVDGQMATKMNLDGSNSNIDTLTFKTTGQSTDPLPEGKARWNSADKTLDLGMDGAGIVQQVGMETFYPKAQNKDTVTIHNGALVEYMGTLGNSGVLLIKRATAVMPIPHQVLGVATEEIAPNAEGRITWFGQVRAIQTNGANYGETWVDGDILYNNPNYLGGLTKVLPTAPFPTAIVAVVMRAHASNGSLFVRPDFLPYLGMLSDVQITNPLNGQTMVYNGTLGRWENLTLSVIQNATEANAKIEASSTGAVITRNVNDANIALKVNQQQGTGNILDLQFGGVSKASVSRTGNITAGYLFTPNGMGNSTTMNNALVSVPSTGTIISRDVADANPALKVNQANASSTGLITDFQFGGTSKASVDIQGTITSGNYFRVGGGGLISSSFNYTYSQILPRNNGALIYRDRADANVALTVNQNNASSTGNIAEFQKGGSPYCIILPDGRVQTSAILNLSSANNAKLDLTNSGSVISRNIADANPVVKINLAHASSTGNIAEFQWGGATVSKLTRFGYLEAQGMYNPLGTAYAWVYTPSTGTIISRNLADANTALTINHINTGSTGKILDLQFGGVSKAHFDKDGILNGLVAITDVGNYYTSTDVDGALQEIGLKLAGLQEALDQILGA